MSHPQGDRVSGLNLWQWRRQAQDQASAAAIPAAEVDWLLQHVTPLDRLTLRLESFKDWEAVELALPFAVLCDRWQQRLEARIPIQYVAGVAPWRTFLLRVSPAVLIPRPETEILVDLAIAAVRQHPHLAEGHWADLGTGSGAIAIGLAAELPHVTIHAIDTSEAALVVAQQNAQQSGFNDRIVFHHGSWFEPIASLSEPLSGLISNPPYIPSSWLDRLQPEVAQHEPRQALDGGLDGFNAIDHLITTAPAYLKSGGVWLVETMSGQAESVADRLQQQGSYRDLKIFADLAGIDRFVLAYRV